MIHQRLFLAAGISIMANVSRQSLQATPLQILILNKQQTWLLLAVKLAASGGFSTTFHVIRDATLKDIFLHIKTSSSRLINFLSGAVDFVNSSQKLLRADSEIYVTLVPSNKRKWRFLFFYYCRK